MTIRAAKRAQWARVVACFRRSGLSKRAFAQREGLNLKHLENWCYRLRAPNAETSPGPAVRKAVRLIPVSVRPSAISSMAGAGQLLVDVRSLQIAVSVDADPRHVAQLVAAIRETTC